MDVINVLKISQKDRRGRNFHRSIGEEELMCFMPDEAAENNDLKAVLTALTRISSIALQFGVSITEIKKQLECSSISRGDIPDLILKSIVEWEKCQ